ncbi:MAG: hypothetical protein MI892_13720, partial [Desulfobacterales bacterium]|nr:hypothetical protein [Desulfobacterales bacterium]
ASGKPIAHFLEFPPKTVPMEHAPFSLITFCLILVFILATCLPFVKTAFAYTPAAKKKNTYPFPWWGFLSLAWVGTFWCLAWTRLDWFAPFQPHTFFPLWLGVIILINAACFRQKGSCPLTKNTAAFVKLFPVSALFWWAFEFLNRFVGNWYYTGSEYPALTYFCLATLSFSTVLPAVESMKELLLNNDRIANGFSFMAPMDWLSRKPVGWLLIVAGSICLALISIFPETLFFTVWIAPFFILLGYAVTKGLPHPFNGLLQGDFTQVGAYALAAVCCGVLWELFNFYSLARWTYSIPYVQVLHFFEMPILGYAGYLPFGLECALIIHMIYPNDR